MAQVMKNKDTNKKNKSEEEKSVIEIGGPSGPEPTRYGIESPEWEKNGRVSDF